MKLPHANQARAGREKFTEYLLNRSHPDGKNKAEFFTRFGFDVERWELLANAMVRHAVRHDVVRTVESAHGTRYAVDGPLECPDGRHPLVRSVWLIEKGSRVPRLITAYPLEEGS